MVSPEVENLVSLHCTPSDPSKSYYIFVILPFNDALLSQELGGDLRVQTNRGRAALLTRSPSVVALKKFDTIK